MCQNTRLPLEKVELRGAERLGQPSIKQVEGRQKYLEVVREKKFVWPRIPGGCSFFSRNKYLEVVREEKNWGPVFFHRQKIFGGGHGKKRGGCEIRI